MKLIGMFDVIGPKMVGPSSSHTAGAVVIGNIARTTFDNEIERAEFTLFGSFADTYRGHGTDKALLGGILGLKSDNSELKNSFEIATKKGINYEFFADKNTPVEHPNTVKFVLTSTHGITKTICGVSLGGGRVKIIEINGIAVDFTGEHSTLVIEQINKCGVATHITESLSKENINIAFLRIFREKKNERAFTVVEYDEQISDEIIERIKSHKHIKSVTSLHS